MPFTEFTRIIILKIEAGSNENRIVGIYSIIQPEDLPCCYNFVLLEIVFSS